MRGSYQLGRLFGIGIRAHWLFLALLGWAFVFWGGLGAVVGVCFVFGLVVLHELGHSLVARRYGVGVRDITLTPIGGMARLEGMPPTPNAEFWIALAGPMVNLVLAALLWPLVVVLGTGSFVFELLLINLALAVFNLLPGFPLDGGRLLRAWLAKRYGMVEATRRAARAGRWVAAGMAVVAVLSLHFILLFIALFVYVAGKQEELAVRLRYAQAPTVEFDPSRGVWQHGPRGPGSGAHGHARGVDPRVVDEMLRRMKEKLGRRP